MSKLIWLSYTLGRATPVYGGGDGFAAEPVKSIAAGDSCNTSFWHTPNHTGTHVDAPNHFSAEGATVDSYAPSFWIFNRVCLVEPLLEEEQAVIDEGMVIPRIQGDPELLLIKTGFCYKRDEDIYIEDYPGLSPGLGLALRERCPTLRAVGVDLVSISSWRNRNLGREAHRVFLDPDRGNPLALIEDMDLSRVNRNTDFIEIIALPLRVEGADGAPCSIAAEVASL